MLGNAAALSRLLLVERSSLLRVVARIVGSALAAEDVTQTLWLRIQRIEDEPPIVNKRAYLFRLAANLAIDQVRADRRQDALFQTGILLHDLEDDRPSAESQAIDRERLDALAAAIEELPLRCRQVFTLRRIDGLPADEVAKRLGITLNTVAKHVRSAVRHCQERMQDDTDA